MDLYYPCLFLDPLTATKEYIIIRRRAIGTLFAQYRLSQGYVDTVRQWAEQLHQKFITVAGQATAHFPNQPHALIKNFPLSSLQILRQQGA